MDIRKAQSQPRSRRADFLTDGPAGMPDGDGGCGGRPPLRQDAALRDGRKTPFAPGGAGGKVQ